MRVECQSEGGEEDETESRLKKDRGSGEKIFFFSTLRSSSTNKELTAAVAVSAASLRHRYGPIATRVFVRRLDSARTGFPGSPVRCWPAA